MAVELDFGGAASSWPPIAEVFCRFPEDGTLPSQYDWTSAATVTSDADGTQIPVPTGASAPDVTQGGNSPGTIGTLFRNGMYADGPDTTGTAGAQFVDYCFQWNMTSGDRTTATVGKYLLYMVTKREKAVGANDNAQCGMVLRLSTSSVGVLWFAPARNFNEANWQDQTATAGNRAAVTISGNIAVGDWLRCRIYTELPSGIGGGSIKERIEVYNMGSTRPDIGDTGGTLIGSTNGDQTTFYTYTSFGGEVDDATEDIGFHWWKIGDAGGLGGSVVNVKLGWIYAEAFGEPTLALTTGEPTTTYLPAGQDATNDTGWIYLSTSLVRNGNNGNAVNTVQTAPSTSGVTCEIVSSPGTGAGNVKGVIRLKASAGATTGAGTVVIRSTVDGETPELTVNYNVKAPIRAAGLPVYISAVPAAIFLAGSSTPNGVASAFATALNARLTGGNNWAVLGYTTEATGKMGISSTRIDQDWKYDESTGGTSPGATRRMVALSLAANGRVILTIPPVSNSISGGASVADTLDATEEWIQHLLDIGFDVRTVDVGVRFPGTSPIASGTTTTGSTVDEIICNAAGLSTTPGTYNDRYVAVIQTGTIVAVQQIASHTFDGTFVHLTLTGDLPATAPGNAVVMHILDQAYCDDFEEINAQLLLWGTDGGGSQLTNATLGTTCIHTSGWFNLSKAFLDSAGSPIYTHQSGDGYSLLASHLTDICTVMFLEQAVVTLDPVSAVLENTEQQDFDEILTGADYFGEDVFPTNLIPGTWSVFSGGGSVNSSGLYTSNGTPATVHWAFDYDESQFGSANITQPASGGGGGGIGGGGGASQLGGTYLKAGVIR